MAKNYVATTDGVLLKVGDRAVSLYRDGAAPAGADPAHVALLLDRGLLAEAEDDQGAPEEDHSSADDKEAADKAAASKTGGK